MEKYSVLMSVYSKENPKHLEMAMKSIIHQSLRPNEIILVEDGPLNDELYTVIKQMKSEYSDLITSIVLEKNEGLGVALQKGLLVSKNEIIARMDTDDIAVENRCELQLDFLNDNPAVSIVGGQIEEFVGDATNIIGRRIVPTTEIELKKYIQKRCPFNHMTVMFRKSDVLEVGNYQNWYYNEDYYLWIRLALANKKFANLSKVLVRVRVGDKMYQRRGGIKYFLSEYKIQNLMLKKGMIDVTRYCINVIERLIIQVFMPSWIRGVIFRKFARKK